MDFSLSKRAVLCRESQLLFEIFWRGCRFFGQNSRISHNPFVFYADIYGNSTRCGRIVNANPGANGYLALPTLLLSDLNSVSTASNYMWLTPNLCNDGHDVCVPLND